MAELRVRLYNVLFGDAILVSVPDRESRRRRTRHILIDVGNVLGGEGGLDTVFRPVVEDVLAELGGEPLDLYVMTHEHLDHVQGLPFAAELGLELPVRYAWLTASSEPGYYDRFQNAERKHSAALAVYEAIRGFVEASPEEAPPGVKSLLLNNNPKQTGDCVEYLRGLAETTTYVYRGAELAGTHPFEEARLELWAPEEDTSIYYGRFRPMGLGSLAGQEGEQEARPGPVPPPGVDAQSFFNLVEARERGFLDNLLAIDRAANDSSVVLSLEWRGWRLLFPGDAEHRSWKEMAKRDLLRPVHFLKVSHHGSWNGTPTGSLLDQILPSRPRSPRPRFAAVSTCLDTYDGVPHRETLDVLAARLAAVRSTLDLVEGELALDITFPG